MGPEQEAMFAYVCGIIGLIGLTIGGYVIGLQKATGYKNRKTIALSIAGNNLFVWLGLLLMAYGYGQMNKDILVMLIGLTTTVCAYKGKIVPVNKLIKILNRQ